MEKPIEEQLLEQERKLEELLLERWETYQKVQNFSVSDNRVKGISKVLREKKHDINYCQGVVNRLKKDLGYSSDQIKREDRRNVMNPTR